MDFLQEGISFFRVAQMEKRDGSSEMLKSEWFSSGGILSRIRSVKVLWINVCHLMNDWQKGWQNKYGCPFLLQFCW